MVNIRNIPSIFMVALGFGHSTSTLHDSKIQWRVKHNSTHRIFPRLVSFLLRDSLVFVGLCRINNWESLVLASFMAGIVQTLLYADFIYYFVKSNQNERIIKLPIWCYCQIIILFINIFVHIPYSFFSPQFCISA